MEVSIQETVDVDLGLKTNKNIFGHFEDSEVLRKCGLYRIAVNLNLNLIYNKEYSKDRQLVNKQKNFQRIHFFLL